MFPRRLSNVRLSIVMLLTMAGLLAGAAAQASAATMYWNTMPNVGTQQIDDATGVLSGTASAVANSTGCRGEYSWSANSTRFYAASGDTICQGNLDGTVPTSTTLVTTGCSGSAAGIGGIFATDVYVYYACRWSTRIGRINVDGSDSRPQFATTGGDTMQYPLAMTSDANWLYVAVTGDGTIRRFPIDGGLIDRSFSIPGLGNLRGIAVDSRYIYWTDGSDYYVGRANLDGTGAQANWLNVGSSYGTTWGLAVTGSSVYWITRRNGGSVGRANLDGTGGTPLVTGIDTRDERHQVAVVGGTAKASLGAAVPNIAVPTTSGTVAIGAQLTVDVGSWQSPLDETHIQWQTSADDGATWSAVTTSDAQTSQHTVTTADMNKRLRVQVRAGNAGGLLTAAYSVATIAVPPPPAPVNTTAPTLSGTAKGAQVVSMSTGSWTSSAGDPTFTYQWQTSPTGGDPWTAATGTGNATTSYLVQTSDSGNFLRGCVTAFNGNTATSCTTATSVAAEPYPTRIYTADGWSILGDDSGRSTYWSSLTYRGFSSNGTTNFLDGRYAGPISPSRPSTVPGGSESPAILVDDQYLYTSHLSDGTISRMAIDGSNLLPSFVTGRVGSTDSRHLTRDRSFLYFNTSSGIGRASITGGAAENGFVAGQGGQGIAVDSDHIYWTEDESRCIGRADITGTGIENCWVDTGLPGDYPGLTGLGVDRATLYAYIRPASGSRGLLRVNIDGTGLMRMTPAVVSNDVYPISVIQASGAAGPLPVNTGGANAPAITGTPLAAETLTVSNGTWTNTPESYTYRWLVSDDGSTGWSVASGVSGTTTSYTIPGDYAGKYLKARVIAHNGSTWSDAAYTRTVWVPALPINTMAPVMTGTVRVGETLSASTGTWTYPPADATGYAYAWESSADGSTWEAALGEGADSAEYDVDLSDDGKYLRVRVTATNDGGATAAYSTSLGPVDILAPTSSAVPEISGTAEIGSTLTASSGTWDFATDYAYAWQSSADGSTWEAASGSGASTSAYTVVAADAGRYLRVRVTGSNRVGELAVASEASTRVPSPASPVPTPTTETPAPVFSPAPGISVGETRGEAVLAAAVPAAGADLLRGAKIWVRPTSKTEFVAESLPDGLKLVDGKLVATKPGAYTVTIKVKRANGTTVMRKIKIKVG